MVFVSHLNQYDRGICDAARCDHNERDIDSVGVRAVRLPVDDSMAAKQSESKPISSLNLWIRRIAW